MGGEKKNWKLVTYFKIQSKKGWMLPHHKTSVSYFYKSKSVQDKQEEATPKSRKYNSCTYHIKTLE